MMTYPIVSSLAQQNRHSLMRGFARGLLAFAVSLIGFASVQASEADLAEVAREQFAFAAKQYAGMLARIEGEKVKLPRTFEKGAVRLVPARDWTSGFFPGALWLVYEQTGDSAMKTAAEDFTKRVESIQFFKDHHDVGFMLGCSYGEGLRITANEAYRAVLVQGARSLATRYKTPPGLIRSWDAKEWKYPVIVDNMMNLELLWYANKQTGEAAFRDIAINHADKTLANHFRADGSSFHLVDYDPEAGGVLKKQTVQGAADGSAWARGQAWGLHGYATMARLTGEGRYLEQARKIAAFVMTHPNMPADAVPFWDFNAPGIPDAPRDASAAAVMACGFLELSDVTRGEESARYRAFAEKQLRSLAGPKYRAAPGENGNFLLLHSVGHKPQGTEVDVPLNYADYYFLKALSRYGKAAVKAAGSY